MWHAPFFSLPNAAAQPHRENTTHEHSCCNYSLDTVSMPLVKDINPHRRACVHYPGFNLPFAEIYHGRFDQSLHLTTLLVARLVRDRSSPTPKLIRDKKGPKVLLRAVQCSFDQTPMVIARPLKYGPQLFQMLSQYGFFEHLTIAL